MDPHDKHLLEEAVELSRENNKILKSMQRSARIGRIITILYWTVIIGATVGAFYAIQPYIEQLLSVYSGIQGGVNNIQNLFQ